MKELTEVSSDLKLKARELIRVLESQEKFEPVLGFPISDSNTRKVDLSTLNTDLSKIDLSNVYTFSKFIAETRQPYQIAIGGYDEKRMIYQRSLVFGDPSQSRSIHLGIDIWTAAGTKIYTPLAGKVHSFNFNKAFGDYGATIILQHSLEEIPFYTLYGHLSLDSIKSLRAGQAFEAGTLFCEIGNTEENGHWPPHLHFQIITDMMGMTGDFPGVASHTDRELYLTICPDPNLILRTAVLKN